MNTIEWPEKFPDCSAMLDIIKKTNEVSWKSDLTIDNVYDWLDNFTGKSNYDKEDERRIALWMLCNFSFYNEDEINYLCRIAYKYFLHDLAKEQNNAVNNYSSEGDVLDKVYFAAVGHASESGGLLLYHFRQEVGLGLDKFFYPTTIPEDENGIMVFIDDVTLSGGTAYTFFNNNIKEMKYNKAYYLTLFASEEAKKRIIDLGINVISSTTLDDRDRCFSDKSIMFDSFKGLKHIAKEIAETYGKLIEKKNPLGYDNGQYCFGLCYNTPNNTLPIFWSSNRWNPIFPRKEKIYNEKQRKKNFDRYI